MSFLLCRTSSSTHRPLLLSFNARPVRYKVRHDCPYCRKGEPHPSDLVPKLPDRKGNPDYPDFLPPGFGTREAGS